MATLAPGRANRISALIKVSLSIFLLYGIFLSYANTSGVFNIQPKKQSVDIRHSNIDIRNKTKYILQWGEKDFSAFQFLKSGNLAFIKNNCRFSNCFVTDNSTYLNLTDFDAIAFNGRSVADMKPSQLPKSRSPKQKYIFAAAESAGRFPVCNKVFDNFFNWTWTYKLSSDFRFGYITIYDLEGNVVGPAIDMKWPDPMKPITDEVKAKLAGKSKAAAWFVSHCKTDSKREDFVADLEKELNTYGWKVDIYGACGKLKCPKSKWRECDKELQKDYYFYLSFENSFAEDYVTEKVLTPLNNYVVPVVYGASNYSRFLPPGSYLDAQELGPKNLSRVMTELIANKDTYYNYFRWRNHFTYKQTIMNEDVCKLCEVLNDEEKVNTFSVWKNFRKWWNSAGHKNCINDDIVAEKAWASDVPSTD